jgi:hypothetical protein
MAERPSISKAVKEVATFGGKRREEMRGVVGEAGGGAVRESRRGCVEGLRLLAGGEVVLESSGRCAEARMGMMMNGLA